MRWRDDETRFGAVTKLLHWTVAGLVAGQIGLALWMTRLPLGVPKLEAYALHKSLGLLILLLMLVRLCWRLAGTRPRQLGPTALQRRLATAAHGALYAVLIAMPLVGWVQTGAWNFPLRPFGLFTLPAITTPDMDVAILAGDLHAALGWILVALVTLHVAAAAKHHLIDRDATLTRMLPFAATRRNDP